VIFPNFSLKKMFPMKKENPISTKNHYFAPQIKVQEFKVQRFPTLNLEPQTSNLEP